MIMTAKKIYSQVSKSELAYGRLKQRDMKDGKMQTNDQLRNLPNLYNVRFDDTDKHMRK